MESNSTVIAQHLIVTKRELRDAIKHVDSAMTALSDASTIAWESRRFDVATYAATRELLARASVSRIALSDALKRTTDWLDTYPS